jgi:hypothetical protein
VWLAWRAAERRRSTQVTCSEFFLCFFRESIKNPLSALAEFTASITIHLLDINTSHTINQILYAVHCDLMKVWFDFRFLTVGVVYHISSHSAMVHLCQAHLCAMAHHLYGSTFSNNPQTQLTKYSKLA